MVISTKDDVRFLHDFAKSIEQSGEPLSAAGIYHADGRITWVLTTCDLTEPKLVSIRKIMEDDEHDPDAP